MTRLKITAGGFDFIAETHPDAPLTVAAFPSCCPTARSSSTCAGAARAAGCRWANSSWRRRRAVGFENHTSHPSVGDILFYPGGYSETEIILAYGACSFASKMGQLAGNHFLTIVEGRENLRELGAQGAVGRRAGRAVRSSLRADERRQRCGGVCSAQHLSPGYGSSCVEVLLCVSRVDILANSSHWQARSAPRAASQPSTCR